MRRPRQSSIFAVKAKVKAVAFMATREHDILYRHTNSGAGEIDRLPMVIVAREDGERIARLLAAGNLVWGDLSIPNQLGGPIHTSNVVGGNYRQRASRRIRDPGRAP